MHFLNIYIWIFLFQDVDIYYGYLGPGSSWDIYLSRFDLGYLIIHKHEPKSHHPRQGVHYRLVLPVGPPGAGMGPASAGPGAQGAHHWASPVWWPLACKGLSLYQQAGKAATSPASAPAVATVSTRVLFLL